ncbi:MAG: alpha/beta hydrolase [Aeromicrobium sp.]|uniref:alpha/beta fold hydrolase n=1 Tax=Aeromicrobium sp. TaxID=1871063 RepID=UPI00262F6722|nr:alpha/beta hydrolase [Aeromicrobium sp.]MDF1706006.1 alpha/beta hydrolase [Aeromicrobium sp.]
MTRAELLNASVRGPSGAPVIVFVHGFGCGQHMWRHVAPSFEADHQVVLLDLPGSGDADEAGYDPDRHASLEGYRDDLAALLQELGLSSVTLVGHSVAAMIGVLLQIERPDLVGRLVLVAPSARYVDVGDYVGGHSEPDIDELLDLLSRNHLGWQDPLSTMVAGSPEGPAKDELEQAFCRTRPEFAAQFANVTFRGDNRADLPHVTAPTLVLQSAHDVVAPESAGQFVRDAIPGAQYRLIQTRGHAPHLTAPADTLAAIRDFLAVTTAPV